MRHVSEAATHLLQELKDGDKPRGSGIRQIIRADSHPTVIYDQKDVGFCSSRERNNSITPTR